MSNVEVTLKPERLDELRKELGMGANVYTEIEFWCYKICQWYYKVFWRPNYSVISNDLVAQFADPAEAVLFKLRWG